MADLSIYVDGVPISHLGSWGNPVLTHRFPYGSWEMTWEADYPPGYRHPAIRRGARAVAKVGPTPLWRGKVAQLDFAAGAFLAEGTVRQAETSLAFSLSGATTDLDEAIFFAAARGALDFGTLLDFGPAMDGVTGAGPINYVMDLLDAYAARNATNLMIDPEGVLYKITDPTAPTIKLEPEDGELGLIDEQYWTTLTGLYRPTTSTTATVTSVDNTQGAGWREGGVDLTGLGVISTAQAQAALDAMLAKGLARTGWTDPVEAIGGQVTNLGGTRIDPWFIALQMATTGVMARLVNMKDPRGVTLNTDVVIEETVWTPATDTIVLKPRGLDARDLASVIETMGGVLAA